MVVKVADVSTLGGWLVGGRPDNQKGLEKNNTHLTASPEAGSVGHRQRKVEKGLLTLLSACCPRQLLDPRH